MRRRSNQSAIRSRISIVVCLSAVAIVAMAARQPATPPQAAPKPAAAASAPTSAVAPVDSQKAMRDSAATPADSTAMAGMAGMTGMAGMDHSKMMTSVQPKATSGQWPVDPVTGQTIINGVPVVGRVFTLQHTDGTVKYANVAAVRRGEPPAPAAATVKHSYAPAKSTNTRRIRGVMVQATLWDMDHKRSATRARTYGPQR